MNINISSALGILSVAETARKEGCLRVCQLLALDSTSTIARILYEREQRLGAFDATLLEMVAKIVEDHKIKRNITDWPFEHFWGNLYEPRHSKLLAYFINPHEEHGCGTILLQKLFAVLLESKSLPADHEFLVDDLCRVSQPEYIDLLIERKSSDRKYAIIIENKINWAVDQWKQLQRYVESVRRRGFDAKQIYVLYLPLTSSKDPTPNDIEIIRKLGVNYNKITFETHIVNWLESIKKETELKWSATMQDGMRENLSHYLNLIRFLVNKQKEHKMNHELLKQLKLAETKNHLPTWSQVESLKKSADELKSCLESVLRGKLLLEILRLLHEQREDVWFCLYSEPAVKVAVADAYDELFVDEVCLCVHTDDAVSVCCGYDPDDGFWLGYMRIGSPNEQNQIEPLVLSEAQACLRVVTGTNKPWYAWVCQKEVTYDNWEEKSSPIAEKLVDMRKRLVDRLKRKA